MSALTPLKYDNKSCCFCKFDSNKYCLIDSEYGVTKSLKSLIQQYLNVNIISGRLCRSCEGKLLTVNGKINELKYLFRDKCGNQKTKPLPCVKRLIKSPLKMQRECVKSDDVAQWFVKIRPALDNISRTSTNSLINLCDQLPFSDKVSQNVADVSNSLLIDDKDERNVCNRFS